MSPTTPVVAACAALLFAAAALAQPTSRSPLAPSPNGPRSAEPTVHVLRGAVVHPAPGVSWDAGTIVLADGRVARADRGVADAARDPDGARTHDLRGLHVYPAFVDAFVAVECPELDADRPGAHWNGWVTPDRLVSSTGVPEDVASARRSLGFAAAAIAPDEGVFAGQGAVVGLGEAPADPSASFERLYRDRVFHTLRFQTGSWRTLRYPTSHPGAVALMRQTLSDADHQARAGAEPNALTPLEDRDAAPLMFDCDRELELLLASGVAAEHGRPAALVGNGLAFKWLDAVAETGLPVVAPLRFPRKPSVATPGQAEEVELKTLMAWEHAPANVARLIGAGVPVAITASKLPRGGEFHDHLREAIDAGLSEDDALAALTTVPARLLGVGDQLGTIEPGKRANLIVCDGPIFDEDTRILDVWIDGRRHVINEHDGPSLDGVWALDATAGGEPLFGVELTIRGTARDGSPEATSREPGDDDARKARKLAVDGARLSFLLDDVRGLEGVTIVSGALQPAGAIMGSGVAPDGRGFNWTARRLGDAETDDDDDADGEEAEDDEGADEDAIPDLPGDPFGPYALPSPPPQDFVLITNATVWTLEGGRVIEDGWVLLDRGRIRGVGGGSPPPASGSARVIDAAGGHVTPGLIDAHSHTGLFGLGVNEAGQAVTAEVRIADSVDPSSISWYRQLAAGVTTVLSLHGSANPIGGQSQTNKIRWGARSPAEMRFEGSRPGIKFALGENVKRSNWGREQTTRYPQTRMGVEAIIRDRFTAAREYARAMGSDDPPRRDLELEALAEVLAGERLVHCHSYRQDEILMLCRVAEDYGFRIGTFQHGLEVYKVAEAVRDAAIGASLFSDWWMYKVEVIDAIPFAGPLQTEVGVLTSYNSDSDELARRMNLEAAKARRYARLDDAGEPVISESDALAFLTINPAIQLGIDHRVGSLAAGKDADVVVWSHHPLSTRAVVRHTFVDGRELFSLERDAEHRGRIAAERRRIIEKILGSPDRDRDEAEPGPDSPEDEILASWVRELHATGRLPEFAEPGDCGCGLINHRLHVFLEKHGIEALGDHHHHHHRHDHAGH